MLGVTLNVIYIRRAIIETMTTILLYPVVIR